MGRKLRRKAAFLAAFMACLLFFTAPASAPGDGAAVPAGAIGPANGASGPAAFVQAAVPAAVFDLPLRPFHARKGEDLVRKTGKECRDCHAGQYYPQGDFFGWEAGKKWRLHWILFSLAGFVALSGVFASASIWSMGRSRSLHHPVRWAAAARSFLWEVVLGRRIWRQSRLRWAVFLLVSMGFVSLAIVFAAMVVTRYLFVSSFFLTGAGGLVLDFLADLLGVAILAGCLLALLRRALGREVHLETEGEDVGILLLLLFIVLTGFFLEAVRLAVVAPDPRTAASFVGFAAARALGAWELPWVPIRFYVWVLHAVLVFALFAVLPFTKLFHVITCPVSVLATASESSYRERQ
ncbi:MAG: respiratory nitrate reductase subunit gamma [bacterium]